MLKALANHGRFLAFGDRRGHVLKPNHRHNNSIINNHGPVSRAGFRSLLYRKFSQFKGSYWGHDLHGRHGFNSSSLKGSNYCLSKSRSSRTQNAQLVWRRPNFTCLHRVSTFLPFMSFRRLACAMSLSFNRYHVVPRVLALAAGGTACIQKVGADGEYCNTIEGFSARARDGHIYLSSVLYSVYEGAILLFRAVYLAFLFSPAIVMAPFADRFGIHFRRTWLQLVHSSLEKAGPAFIKWGQWAATRPDLFPKDLCVELAKLHSKAPTHSFAYSRIAIEKAFGRKLSEIFEHFEETPVASGSIAQVHRASLRFQYPGQQLKKPIEVAVKVRHPGVGESIRRDFVIINLVATISSVIPALSWLRLDESVRQFAVFMLSQVDLAREASNLSRFIYNFRSRRWKDVSFPKPLYPLIHPSVLVETFEQGESVSHYIDDLQGNAHINKDLAHNGTHAFLKMLLEDNFLHADMHPGNILVRVPQRKLSRKGLFKAKPHIVFLDVGMTAELSNDDRVNLLEFFKAVAVRDGQTAAKCTLRFSKQQNCPNPKAFVEELEKTFSFWGTPEGDFFHPVECMHQLLEQVRRHRVNVDGNVCTVMVTILVLEGWQRKLDPNFDIMHTLKTLLLKHHWSKPSDCISA